MNNREDSESPLPPPEGPPPATNNDDDDKVKKDRKNNINKAHGVNQAESEPEEEEEEEEREEQEEGEEEFEEDYSILRDAAMINHRSPERHPPNKDIERSFHQLRLEQRVAGELAGVLREENRNTNVISSSSVAADANNTNKKKRGMSALLAAATDLAKEAKRKRDEFMQKENLQVARENETSYQQEEVATQAVRRLDGMTDVLQRCLDCERKHFNPLRDMEDRIITKQHSAQRKKLELQRLQAIAEDCIGQLTTFELHNAQRERSLGAMEKEAERKKRETRGADDALEARTKVLIAREAKIKDWVDALEAKENHLKTSDKELQNWADEFLKREEALRLAKKENTRPAMHQHQQHQQHHYHQGSAPPPVPPRPGSNAGAADIFSAHQNSADAGRFAHMKQSQFHQAPPHHHPAQQQQQQQPPPPPPVSHAPRAATSQGANGNRQQQHMPEALDVDDDETPARHSNNNSMMA